MKNLKSKLILALIAISTLAQSQNNKSLLWEISGNGLEESSYLFGTIHVKCPSDLKFSTAMQNALEDSERLVLELDMDDENFMPEMQKQSINKGMENISSRLSKEDLDMLNEFFRNHYGSGLEQLGVMKPFVLMSMMFIKGLDCPSPASYEAKLIEVAKKQDWEVDGLEEIADQFAIFDNVSIEEQLSWLVDYAKDEEGLKRSIQELLEAYDQQNIEKIVGQMKNYPEYAEIEEEMLYVRNEKWIDGIIAHAKSKATFIAVGAAHLGSDRGLVELLRQEGFTLTPLASSHN